MFVSLSRTARRSFAIGALALIPWSPVLAAEGDGTAQVQPAHAPTQSAQPAPSTPSGLPSSQEAFDAAIRSFLKRHPEVVYEALQDHQTQQEEAERLRAEKALVERQQHLVADPSSPVAGNPNGDVTLVEFFDYQCHFCKRVLSAVMDVLETDKNLKVVFKEFPILGPVSTYASQAALAGWTIDPTKYLTLHTNMMGARGHLTETRVDRFVAEAGYDVKQVKEQMNDPQVLLGIQGTYALAEALNIRGTPAMVVGDTLVPGAISVEQLRQLIADTRAARAERATTDDKKG